MQIPNFLTLFLIPIAFLSIGPILIEIGKEFNTSPANINLVFTFFPAGMVAGQLTSTFYNKRFKRSVIILTAYSIMIAINIYLFFSNNLYVYYILSVVSGYMLGINYVQSSENILACRIKNKDRLFILMVIFYPIGALTAPLISSGLINNGINWRYTFIIIAILILLTAILYILISLKGQNRIIAEEVRQVPIKEIFVNRKKNIIFVVTILIVSIYVASETVISTWTPTYLRLAKGLDINSAALSITVLMIFMIAGRIIAAIVAGRFKAKIIMLILSVITIISVIFIFMANTRFLVFAAMAIAGIGYSAMYPLIVSSGSTIYEKGRGFLVSIIFASAYFGKSLAPYITKLIAEFNLSFSITVSLIFSGTSALLILFLVFYERKNKIKNT
ncbi:sugar MFS transporter [Actinomycetota bacterium]